MRIVLLVLYVFLYSNLQSQSCSCPNTEWVRNIGGNEFVRPGGVALNSSGNFIVTGSFINSVSFGSSNLTSSGDWDIFIASMDSQGNWLWAVKTGGAKLEEAISVTLDKTGNIYLIGMYQVSSTIGGTTLSYDPNNNLFIAKLNSMGQWQWVVKAGRGEFFQSSIRAKIQIDQAGNIYYTSSLYTGSVLGRDTIQAFGYSYRDIVVAKINANGQWLWTTHAGKSGVDSKSNDILLKSNSQILVTGLANINSSFKNSTLSTLTTGAFYATLDSSGRWQNIVQLEGGEAMAINKDNIGNIYLSGFYENLMRFGNKSISSIGQGDVFVSKFNPSGSCLWLSSAGGTDFDNASDIDVLPNGDPIVTGYAQYYPVFGSISAPYFSPAVSDKFIAKLNSSNGDWCWVKQIGQGIGDVEKQTTILDSIGSIYTLNRINGVTSFYDSIIIPQNRNIGCVLVKTEEKKILISPIADRTINNGDSLNVIINGENIDSFSVFPSAGVLSKSSDTILLSPLVTTTYTLYAIDKCKNIDSIKFQINVQTNPIGLNDITSEVNLRTTPNPFLDFLFIEIKSPSVISVFDLSGSLVFKKLVDRFFEVNTSLWSSGVYLLKTDDGFVRKIVKE
jgi:hypothetical protein